MPDDEATQLVAFFRGHEWPGVAWIVIAMVVRLLKSDTKIPIDVPAKYRAYLALALGVVSGVLQKVVQEHVDWTTAIVGGVCSAALAAFSHDTIVDAARGGKELVVPGLIVKGAAPGPGKPVSLAPDKGEDVVFSVPPDAKPPSISKPTGQITQNTKELKK